MGHKRASHRDINIFFRYLETGIYSGWMEQFGVNLVSSLCRVDPDGDPLPLEKIYKMPIFTQKDLNTLSSTKEETKTGDDKRVHKRVTI